MQKCSACSAPLREGARFCTRCGGAVDASLTPEQAPITERAAPDIPARVPARGRTTPPAARSTAATWTLVTGVTPLLVSIIGNLVAASLAVGAGAQVAAGDAQGAWAGVLVVVSLLFVVNAALLTLCTIMGGRALRETSNGITRGRPLAVAGLAAGGVNLVLWVSGLIVSVSGFDVFIA